MSFKGLTIAVPREIMAAERRVALTPDMVKKCVEAGGRVLVESGAGASVFYSDDDYVAAGAEIASGPEQVFAAADIILKVKEPQFNQQLDRHEVELFPEGSTLICFLHPANPANHEMVRRLAERRITGFTLDSVPRISRAQQMDALTSMSTVAGYKASITAAHRMSRFMPMIPTATGMFGPAQVIVVGVGVAGLQALATAKRLGAKVKALDIRPEANEQAKSLGAQLIEFELPAGMGVGEGGYAQRLPDDWYAREREALLPHVREADAVILAALVPGEEAPTLLDEAMVEQMPRGSVVVDISIDQGGNCSLTRSGEEYDHNGVFISGLANTPAYLAVDAARMFAQNIHSYLAYMVKDGQINLDPDDEIVSESLVTHDGSVVHEGTLKAMK